MNPSPKHKLILASSSIYRKELLGRLGVPFESISPQVDETPLPDEQPEQLALRLAQAKALALAKEHPNAYVIGSDQVLDLHGAALGKPHDHERALAQLMLLQGESVRFHTAVCISFQNQVKLANVITAVTFKKLKESDLENYLLKDQPYDCAGSAKSEALGIALLERVTSDDPTALVGLPLITVATFLQELGLNVLAS